MRRRGGIRGGWSAGAALLVFLMGTLPVLLALATMSSDWGEAGSALRDATLWRRLGTTTWIAVLSLGVAVPVGLVQAWLLTRSDLPGRGLLRWLMPLPLFLPPLVHVLGWFGMTGMRGMPAIVMVTVIAHLPLVAWSAALAFGQINRDQADEIRLLGGEWAVFREDLRQGLPAAGVGAALALVFVISEAAVADFLTAVGPKVTVYGDTLHAHQAGWRPAAAAAASLPGMLLAVLALGWVLRWRRALGVSVGGDFARATPVRLGRWRWPAYLGAGGVVGAGTVVPLAGLLVQCGSLTTWMEQARVAGERVVFSLQLGAGVATALAGLGLPLAALALRRRLQGWVDLLVFLPLATPALLFVTGQVLAWNRPGLDAVYGTSWMLGWVLTGRYLAVAYLPLAGALERLDPALDEAARLAGAGVWTRWWRVRLPLIRPALLTSWCVSFAFTLRELDTLYLLGPGQRTLTFHLQANVVFARQDEVAAIALLLMGVTAAPLLLLSGLHAITRRQHASS